MPDFVVPTTILVLIGVVAAFVRSMLGGDWFWAALTGLIGTIFLFFGYWQVRIAFDKMRMEQTKKAQERSSSADHSGERR